MSTNNTDNKQLIKALEEAIVYEVSSNGEKGIAKINSDVYLNNLPEGMTKTAAIEYQKHQHAFNLAAIKVAGDKGLAFLKANPKVESVEATIGVVGRDVLDVTVNRQRNIPKRDAAFRAIPNEFDTVYGRISAGLKANSTRGSEFKQIREDVQNRAAKLLGK